jgi:glycolate oxidase FAD binding subunit
MHDLIAEWSERIRTAAERGRPLEIRGSGSKSFYGEPARGEPFITGNYRGILEYEPTELVLSARAGTPLAEIEATLTAQGQMLAFEPPHFGDDATLGGAIATGLSGPRRASAGSARDFVLGVRILDGHGRDLAFGGKVMKNVAGYDVSRLMVGAMGTLGVVLDVALKVLPQPAEERTLRFALTQDDAIRRLNEWAGKPYPISASCHQDNCLTVRLSGAHAGVAAIAERLGGERVDDAAAYWEAIRDHRAAFFQSVDPLWRIAVKSTTPALPLPGAQLIEWNGALRWVRTTADAALVRDVARKAGGHATLFSAQTCTAARFHPLPPALMQLHARLKKAFDPASILNPGRLYPEL